jgi:hypothetical protein
MDIADLQMRHFRTACPCTVESYQKDSIGRELGCVDQPRQLFRLKISCRCITLVG